VHVDKVFCHHLESLYSYLCVVTISCSLNAEILLGQIVVLGQSLLWWLGQSTSLVK